MNFRSQGKSGAQVEDAEINFIPLIDVLLVILIFLMVTTTYSKYAELQIMLPTADANKAAAREREIDVAVTADGRILVDRKLVARREAGAIAEALKIAASARQEPTVVINADAGATHQAVIDVMEGARMAGLARLTFATQTSGASR